MRSLLWLRQWADLLDARFRVPGTRIRFGLDPILSMIPGVGDLASPMFTVAILVQAVYQGVPKIIMVRMLLTGLLDACIGAVPLVGTVGDVFFRANLRNLALLERYARPGARPTRGDYAFVLIAAGLFGMLAMIPVIVAIWLTIQLWAFFSR